MQQVCQRKGVGYAIRCDICKGKYQGLPAHLAMHESLPLRVQRTCGEAWQAAVRSPAGPLIQALAASAWMYSAILGCCNAAIAVVDLPRLVLAARTDPSALRPLAPRFAAAALLDPLLFSRTQHWRFHLESVAFYCAGWLLDASARLADVHVLAALPPHLRALASAALWVPKGIGLGFQALDLLLMSVRTAFTRSTHDVCYCFELLSTQ